MEADGDLSKVIGFGQNFDNSHVCDPWRLKRFDELPMNSLFVGVVDHFLFKKQAMISLQGIAEKGL